MLLDASGLFCLHHRAESQHARALEAYRSVRRRLTHSYVLAEFIALASARRIPRPAAVSFLADLLETPDIETIWVDESLHRQAVDLLRTRLDKSYSLCDAVSFVLMRRERLTSALTTDHHFEQEGFQKLL